jgi:hypothetical protein
LGSIALFEGIAALLGHLEGDPEADVETALRQLAEKNQRRAFSLEVGEQEGRESVDEKFAQFNEIPSRILTKEALSRTPQPSRGERNTGLLDMVAARMGLTPEQLGKASHPSRAGDMSSMLNNIKQQQSQQGQPGQQAQLPQQGDVNG